MLMSAPQVFYNSKLHTYTRYLYWFFRTDYTMSSVWQKGTGAGFKDF